ncbi:MAG: hypothetical protein FWH03_06910 [Firmicutes bacterium]|nr:hypothetical protein [Bacillota bacterium]
MRTPCTHQKHKRIIALSLIAVLILAVVLPLLAFAPRTAHTAHASDMPPANPTGTFNLSTGAWNAGGGG